MRKGVEVTGKERDGCVLALDGNQTVDAGCGGYAPVRPLE